MRARNSFIITYLTSLTIGLFLGLQYFWATYFVKHGAESGYLVLVLFLAGMGIGRLLTNTFKVRFYRLAFPVLFILTSWTGYGIYYLEEFSTYTDLFIYLLPIPVGALTYALLPSSRIKTTSILLLVAVISSLFLQFAAAYLIVTAISAIAILILKSATTTSPTEKAIGIVVVVIIIPAIYLNNTIQFFENQQQYSDKIIYEEATAQNLITVTRWRNELFVFINHRKQFSTFDYAMMYEPVFRLASAGQSEGRALIIGGENQIILSGLLRHRQFSSVDHMPLDTQLPKLYRQIPSIEKLQDWPASELKYNLIPTDISKLGSSSYDLIICDLPDPVSTQIAQYYSSGFYERLKKIAKKDGLIIVNASDPIRAPQTTNCIQMTIGHTGMSTQLLEVKSLTSGAWSWVYAIHDDSLQINDVHDDNNTQWLRKGVFTALTSFGKSPLPMRTEVNTTPDYKIIEYYLAESAKL